MKPSVIIIICLLWMGTSSTAKLFGKHNGKHKKRVYHMDTVKESQESVTKKQSTPLNYLTVTDSGPAGMIDVKNPGGTLTAAVGDGTTDDTPAIQAIIRHAAAGTTNNKVFFPPGEYLVSSDIVIPGSVELHGTKIGIAVIKASTPYVHKIRNTNSSTVISVALKNLYFDGILVDFNGNSIRDITVFQSVFFSTASPSGKNGEKGQLKFRDLTNGNVRECVFLRDSSAFGVALKFYKANSVSVYNNVCGLDLSKIDWLSSEPQLVHAWTEQKQKLEFLKSHYSLAADQGFFKSCLYDNRDKNMSIQENVFNGSPNTGSLHKDHAMYLKGFNTMEVVKNYVRGWPADPSGGIKARNGINLRIARNYIDNTGILLYSHDTKSTNLHKGLQNVLIYGNHIVRRNNPGDGNLTIIRYYEPHFTGQDENFRYSANEFEILGVSDPSGTKCIWLTNGDLSQHHVYNDNVYFGTKTTVSLQARNATPSTESGRIDTSISALYRYDPYKLNIPTY